MSIYGGRVKGKKILFQQRVTVATVLTFQWVDKGVWCDWKKLYSWNYSLDNSSFLHNLCCWSCNNACKGIVGWCESLTFSAPNT